jgi:hypothetical protein
MKSELLLKTPTCLFALSVTAEFIIAFIERKQNCGSFSKKTKLPRFLPSKKTKLLFLSIERKQNCSGLPSISTHACTRMQSKKYITGPGRKILTVNFTLSGWVASHPASKSVSYIKYRTTGRGRGDFVDLLHDGRNTGPESEEG